MKDIIAFLYYQNKLQRPWTEIETEKYKTMNDNLLLELNKTLSPPKGIKNSKVAIFAQGQSGDLMTAMGVLKYIEFLWPNSDIIWYANYPNADNLKYSNVSEVRMWPWENNGLPPNTPDFYPLLSVDNRLNKELALQYDLTKDLSDGYFPVPWMVSSEKQHGVNYTECAKMIFEVPMDAEWHPVLNWNDEEKENAKTFMDKLPPNRKNILIENFCGSGQSPYWDEFTTKKIMAVCREKLGPTNFIFASHKHKGGPNNEGLPHDMFIDEAGAVSASHFTVRQSALLINHCDLMVCMSSGISVATSAWGLKPVKKLQYCGSEKCSTVGIANGPIELVTADGKTKPEADKEFFIKLEEILLTI